MNVKGLLVYSIILGIGALYAIPQVLSLLVRFLRNPTGFFAKRNWSAVELPSPVESVHHVLVDVGDEIQIHTVRTFTGSPRKPVMVMVHGFPEAWFSWKHQISAFREHFDVVAISMRGYGLSSKPQGINNYAMTLLASDIVQVIRSLDCGKVVLMGHDWGGGVCWDVAHGHPELLSNLVIACAAHPRTFRANMDFTQFLRSWYMFLFQMPMIPELGLSAEDFKSLDAAFRKPPMGVRRPGALSDVEMSAYKKEMARPGTLTSAINYYRAMARTMAFGPDRRREKETQSLRRVLDVPTLVIWADQDIALGPGLLRGLGKYVSTLRIETLKDCSHWAQQDRPEEFNALVAAFLKE